ncbi:MAG: zinc ribbon domain-containing protein [Micropruina sp.]|uniref:FmdB family zinc ribbon protein n=1 Tax=Micropruina sp. TaxID=2737536 RepID=UPI0039E23A16
MPTYQYRCQDCSSQLEVVQKFTDEALTQCPTCEGPLRKVYSAVGVVFKGSGFYATDSRAAKKKSSGTSKPDSENKPSTSDSKPSGDSKPAPAASSSSSGAPAA